MVPLVKLLNLRLFELFKKAGLFKRDYYRRKDILKVVERNTNNSETCLQMVWDFDIIDGALLFSFFLS